MAQAATADTATAPSIEPGSITDKQARMRLERLRRHGSRRTKVLVRQCRRLPDREALQLVRSMALPWHVYIRPFVEALQRCYPACASDIADAVTEDTGPRLDEYDVYGQRVDTQARVNGLPIWRYVTNDLHVCETAPGSRTLLCWRGRDGRE